MWRDSKGLILSRRLLGSCKGARYAQASHRHHWES